MADQQDYEKMAPALMELDKRKVREPDMPVVQAAKEGELMKVAGMEDAPKFAAINITQEKMSELGAAVGALRYAEAVYTVALGKVAKAGEQWAIEEPKAIALRGDLLATMTYAYRNSAGAKSTLKKIREGTGSDDMISDIQKLAKLGKTYPEQLTAMNFDVRSLDAAEVKSAALHELHAQTFIEKNTKMAKDMRDRAFTKMREIMGEILDAAELIFRATPDRLDYYYSTYRNRRRNSPSTDAATVDAQLQKLEDK